MKWATSTRDRSSFSLGATLKEDLLEEERSSLTVAYKKRVLCSPFSPDARNGFSGEGEILARKGREGAIRQVDGCLTLFPRFFLGPAHDGKQN